MLKVLCLTQRQKVFVLPFLKHLKNLKEFLFHLLTRVREKGIFMKTSSSFKDVCFASSDNFSCIFSALAVKVPTRAIYTLSKLIFARKDFCERSFILFQI